MKIIFIVERFFIYILINCIFLGGIDLLFGMMVMGLLLEYFSLNFFDLELWLKRDIFFDMVLLLVIKFLKYIFFFIFNIGWYG